MRSLHRILLPVLALAVLAARPVPSGATGILPENGDIISIMTPAVTPAIDDYRLVRIRPTTGAVDTIVHLPTGNAPLALTVAPWNGLIYVLGQAAIVSVDPCTGVVATVATGGYLTQSIAYEKILAHSNHHLYFTRMTVNGGVIDVDLVTGAQTVVANPYPTFPAAYGLTEAPDHFLELSTSGGSGSAPWVIRMDPLTGAMNLVASGAQNTNVRDIAYDTRDSLYVLRVGFTPSVHRIDTVGGQVGLLLNLPSFVGNVNGWMAGAPDGYLYIPGAVGTTQYAMFRLNPVSGAFTNVNAQQSAMAMECVAIMRGFVGCPTPVHQETWGGLKAHYR